MENLALRDFLDYKFISNLALSQDGNKLAFTVNTPDYDKNNYKSNIWTLDTKTKDYSKLTALGKEAKFLWLNKETLMFSSMRDEDLQTVIDQGEPWSVFYTISTTGGEAQEYMRIPLAVADIKAVDEDNFVLTATYDNYGIDLHNLKGEERANAVKTIKENKDYEVLDEIPFWFNGVGFTNKKRTALYTFNRKTNTLTLVSDKYTNIVTFKIKGDRVLYVGNTFTDKFEHINSVNEYNLATKTLEILVPQDKYCIDFVDFIGDEVLVTATDMERYGCNENQWFYIVKNGKLELVAEHDLGFGNSVGSDCRYGGGQNAKNIADTLYFVNTIKGNSILHALSKDGTISDITGENGSVDCFDTNGENFYFVGMRGVNLQEIYTIENGVETAITALNKSITDTKTIVTPKYMGFKNRVGMELDGYVIEPVDYDPAKTYPAIMDIHGGPKTSYGSLFYHEMQVWANMGYFVFFSNPRGSDGRDNEFADIRGKYGTIDFEDLMDFNDYVLSQYPQIDASRVGVTGGSYGGFMTNWIIGHTSRYKCAVSQRSISNWISKFGTTDIGYYFNADQNQSTPWVNYDKLWWHSPVKYADKATTPTLFIHSECDYRCWVAEGLQMFTALKYHGIEARLCMFKGENHELSRSGKPKHRVRRLEEMTQWFEKYLK